jgi:hypothetical protein
MGVWTTFVGTTEAEIPQPLLIRINEPMESVVSRE